MIEVLWIDDEPELLNWVQSSFDLFDVKIDREKTINLRFCSDADEGIRLFSDERFDVVLIDNFMPLKHGSRHIETMGGARSGVFVIEAIRRLNPEIPIAMVTAFLSNEYDKKFLEKNKIQHFNKPMAQRILYDYLQQFAKQTEMKQSIVDAIEIKPGIFGLNFDLKKIWKFFAEKLRA